MNDIAKLPKWAQTELRISAQRADAADARADAIIGNAQTSVEIEPCKRDGEHRRYLPDHTTVRFVVDGGSIDVRLMDGRIYIQGSGMRGTFNVHPSASNVVTVGFEPDR